MHPVATYSEVRFAGRRIFELFPDKIVVRGERYLGSEFEQSFHLKNIDPNPGCVRARNRFFQWCPAIALAGFAVCMVLVHGYRMNFWSFAPMFAAWCCLYGVILMVLTARKVEYAFFKNDDGIIILDMAKAGKHAAELDSFVAVFIKQIRETRGLA